ncbi:MAG: hypothetical protein GXY58_18835 [Planctomycetaceae bacterium]|nr:hypothetical protein [Planctomycetaceae bacterium]
MAKSRSILGISAALILSVWGSSPADQPQFTPQPGVLVLRTGRVLRGKISRVGDRYVVTLGGQDEVGVPADSVELQCETLEDAYQQKRDGLPTRRSVADHLALADWCLRYELMGSAAEQLMAAQRLEPDSPEVATFERRLRLAAQQPTAARSTSTPAPLLTTQSDLDQLVRSMPDGTVEQFTNVIQPLLINRCGMSGCHGPNCSSSFRLAYPNWSRTLPRRFTQSNLHVTMQQIDLGKPEDSLLLVNATSAHGTCTHATLGQRDAEQLDQLVEWVHRCTVNRTSPTNLGSTDALPLSPQVPHHGTEPDASVPGSQPAGNPGVPAAATPAAASAIRDENVTAQDPFDPEIFNRRYARRISPP